MADSSGEGKPCSRLTPTIFHEDWWLAAASNNEYRVVESVENGRVVGRLPYIQRKLIDGVEITHPILTYCLGPAVDEGNGSPATRTLKQGKVVRDLMSQLPKFSTFNQILHSNAESALPLQLSGCSIGTRFTFEIQPGQADLVWKRLRDKTRNSIRRGAEKFSVDELVNPLEFCRFYEANLRRASREGYYDIQTVGNIASAARSRGRGSILGARNGDGELSAAIFYAWDRHRSYYLLSSRDSHSAGNGAIVMLIWEAIKHTIGMGLAFDFDGTDNEGRTLLYSGFGAEVTSRYVATRSNLRLQKFRNIWKALAL